jgi:hypothetical protein
MEIEEEAFERATSVGNLAQLIEKVRLDSTPTVEKEIDFGDVGYALPELTLVGSEGDMRSQDGLRLSLPPRLQLRHDVEEDEQPSVSFKQFLLGRHELSSPEDMVDGVSSSGAATEGEDSELPSPELEMSGPGLKGLAGLGINQGDLKTPTQKSFFGWVFILRPPSSLWLLLLSLFLLLFFFLFFSFHFGSSSLFLICCKRMLICMNPSPTKNRTQMAGMGKRHGYACMKKVHKLQQMSGVQSIIIISFLFICV